MEQVSLLQVLSQPEKYHGKEIGIIGYLHLEFEGNGLYLHKEDFIHAIHMNSIWVDVTEKIEARVWRLNDKYVAICGVFDANDTGHMGLFAGTLKNITKCIVWSDPRMPRRSITRSLKTFVMLAVTLIKYLFK